MSGPSFHDTESLAGVPRLGIGMIGCGRIDRAHSIALNLLQYATRPPNVLPRLVAIRARH